MRMHAAQEHDLGFAVRLRVQGMGGAVEEVRPCPQMPIMAQV
jgi:hypothetical protein